MKKGFTLLELLVVIIIVGVLAAIAMPYYFNAVENARTTEVTMLWGRIKNMASGNRSFAQARADRYVREINEKDQLKYFTLNVICRTKENPDEICWEAEFVKKNPDDRILYKLSTINNFRNLTCIGLNGNGEDFCYTMGNETDEKVAVGDEHGYIVKH